MDSVPDILQAVAAGTLDPQTASGMIARMRQGGEDAGSGSAPPPPVSEVLVKAGAVRLVIIGDPAVDQAVAEGPHRMERRDGTLVIRTNTAEGDFATTPPRSALMNWLTSVMDRASQTLTVRVNPALPLRVLIVGGSLDLSGATAGTSVGVEAGAARLEGGEGPLQVDVVSGSAKVDWTFSGDSTVRADMGSAQIRVRPGSDVRITAEATLGQATVRTDHGIVQSVGDAPTAGGGDRERFGHAARSSAHGCGAGDGRMSVPLHRAPTLCPVCSDSLLTLRLGCPGCGTEVSGEFDSCRYCRLADDDLALLEVFLRSRGNLREVQTHLGVSYPTARVRFAQLLHRLDLGPIDPPPSDADILNDLSHGRITVAQAESLLGVV